MTVSRVIAAIALLIVLLAVMAFAVMNPDQRVTINLGFTKYTDVPLVWALFISFVIGILVTLLYCLYYFIDLGLTVRRLKKKTQELESELVAIRNLPVEEEFEEQSGRERM